MIPDERILSDQRQLRALPLGLALQQNDVELPVEDSSPIRPHEKHARRLDPGQLVAGRDLVVVGIELNNLNLYGTPPPAPPLEGRGYFTFLVTSPLP